MKRNTYIDNVNQYRDFIHISDVVESLILLINKKFTKPTNISSGRKINLIDVCKIINQIHVKKNVVYGKSRGKDLFSSNKLLRSIGKKKFKSIFSTINSYKK